MSASQDYLHSFLECFLFVNVIDTAYRLREASLDLQKKIISTTFLLQDSQFVMLK